jgi:hypothetical protein
MGRSDTYWSLIWTGRSWAELLDQSAGINQAVDEHVPRKACRKIEANNRDNSDGQVHQSISVFEVLLSTKPDEVECHLPVAGAADPIDDHIS